jgi:peptide-methionine (S)-S-oxide reductase
MRFIWAALGCTALATGLLTTRLMAHADTANVPAPAYDPRETASTETATLSGGCFWGVQGVYEHVQGVSRVYAGYTGGAADTAQYEIVSTGQTGHAESVEITFDPRVISYGKILQIYFSVAANPTELNYQGPDSGTQYRSEIWYASPAQEKIAAAYIKQLAAAHVYADPIVVRLDQAKPFYEAEAYHQDYLTLHPDNPYIAINDVPKVENLQAKFPELYRSKPATVFPLG